MFVVVGADFGGGWRRIVHHRSEGPDQGQLWHTRVRFDIPSGLGRSERAEIRWNVVWFRPL